MSKYYSGFDSAEEKKNIRQAVFFVLLSVCTFALLAFFIVPLVTNVTSLFGGIVRQNPDKENINDPPPAPPAFDIIPEATNKTPFEITGSVVRGNTVVINFNGSEYEISSKEDGGFSTTVDFIEGDNSLFAYTKGVTGKLSQKSAEYTIYFDNKQPKIEISSPKDGSQYYGTKQQNIEIRGSTEQDSILTVNGRIIPIEDDGSFSYTYSLNEGENILFLKAVDKAGNEKETSLKLSYFP